MDQMGIEWLLFSPRASGMGHEIGGPLVSRYWTETCNDLIARACALHPDRLVGVCQLPQSPGVSPEGCITELERCVNELGFAGCLLNPDVAGGGQPFTPSLGDRWWHPLFEKLVELDVPAMIHATSTVNPALHVNATHYINADAAAVFELCFSDVFQLFPTLKIVVPHGGGGVPFHWNRYRSLHVSARRPPFEEVVRHLYFDTAVYDRDSMEMLIRKVGPDNILFATEPFGTAMYTDPATGRRFDDTVDFVRNIEWLGEDEREKIFSGNARRVFSKAAFAPQSNKR
jgi:4-oxalmesaconate hydratase